MNILFTVCGRAGSKGVRNKNIRDFCGCPLPYYTLAAIELFKKRHKGELLRADIALSTDSPELKRLIASAVPGVFAIDRDASLAGDTVRKIDVIRDAAKRAEHSFSASYDMVVDLDITSPLRTVGDIENVVEKRKASASDVVYTVTEARRNPYFNMVSKKENGFFSTVMPAAFATRQEAPEIFDMNASIYAYSNGYIHSDEPLFKRADVVVMRDTGVLDIDSEQDHALMQVIASYFFDSDRAFGEIRDAAADLAKKAGLSA